MVTKRRTSKEAKFVFNEADYHEELKEIKESINPINPIDTEVRQVFCLNGHRLTKKNWSTVKKSYYCPECLKNYDSESVVRS